MTQLKAILGVGVMTIASVAIVSPASAQPVPEASLNACVQRTAEAMVVPARDIRMTNAGPVDVKGVRTLSMRNMVTGQTADCRVNTIDAFVLDVQLTSNPAPRPPQTVPQASIDACIQRTAESMVVATRDIEFVSAGPISAESGAATLNMRNRTTRQTATCRVNTINNTVLSVQLGGTTTPPAQGRPVPPTDPLARNCQANVGNKIRRSYGGIQQINFLSDTTRAVSISNTQESIRGEGQFRQSGPNWNQFTYNCTMNKRTGNVERATFNVLR